MLNYKHKMAEKVEEDVQKLEALFKILNKENELNNINLFQMINAREFKNRELINKEGNLFLTVDSLIRLNNYITSSRNIQLRQINVKPTFYIKKYMDFTRIESELYRLVDQFNQRKITARTFCDIFLDKIHPFADGNDRTCKVLFKDKIQNFNEIYKKSCSLDYLFFPTDLIVKKLIKFFQVQIQTAFLKLETSKHRKECLFCILLHYFFKNMPRFL